MTDANYQRGYNKGKASVQGKLDEYRVAVEEATQRAIQAEAGIVGPCQKCARWDRQDGCFWGYCNAPKCITIAHESWWGEADRRVCTQENFGCVRFVASDHSATRPRAENAG